jgi:plastocyanin
MFAINTRQVCAAVLAIGACVAAAACSTSDAMNPNPAAPSPPSSTTLTIDIVEESGANSFYPSPASVTAQQMVLWRNADREAHHVVFDSTAVDTGNLAPNTQSQPVTLPAGTWNYHCTIHPSMTGVVTVAGAAQNGADGPAY